MSSYNQQQQANSEGYPPPPASYPASGPAYPAYTAPPPAGYPTTSEDAATGTHQVPVETRSRGDGFWRGCCAALCCCCAVETCF